MKPHYSVTENASALAELAVAEGGETIRSEAALRGGQPR